MINKLNTTVVGAVFSLMAGTALAAYKPLDGDPKIINFGIISTKSTANLKQQGLPFLADMEKTTGLQIKPFSAPDYAGIIEGMRFGKVHAVWFGNESGMEAVDRSGAEVLHSRSASIANRGITQTS